MLLINSMKVLSCNTMVVHLLDIQLRFKTSNDRISCPPRRVIRSSRRYIFVHFIPGTAEISQRDMR